MRGRIMMLALLCGSGAFAQEQRQGAPSGAAGEGVVEPKADAALRRMSDYLGGLQSFQVETSTVDEKVTTDGHKIQELQQSKVLVKRPGQLRVERVSPRGHAVLIDDGRQFFLYNKDKGVYDITRAPASLDAALDDARDRLHIDAPAGDLIPPNSYGTLIDGTITGRYVGLEPVEGVMAHHLAFTKQNTDWQIWIKDGPDPVPLRFVITSRDMPGQPQFTATLRDWQPNVAVPPNTFSFSPPAGARRVDITAPATAR